MSTLDEPFNFEVWIVKNDLNEIKDIMAKHNLNTKCNLSTQSKAFATFISDPLLHQQYSHLTTNAVIAIQQLSSSSSDSYQTPTSDKF